LNFLMFNAPSDAERMEHEADLAAVNSFLDGLDSDGLYALSIILSVCTHPEAGPRRALQFHGEVKAIGRLKFDLCHCGSKHRSMEHGHTENLHDYDPKVLTAYEVEHPTRSIATVVCIRCNCSFASLDERMKTELCHCGAGPGTEGTNG